MRSDRIGLFLGSLLLVAACGSDAPPTTPTPTPAATFVRVDTEGPPQRDLGPPGATLQLRALATLSDGSRPDVTNEAVWSVTDPRVLSVSPRGLVTGIAEGGTIVTATYRERAGVTNLRVANELGPRFQVAGVVRDAERGTPLVGALLWTVGTRKDYVLAVTDGNGFFNLGTMAGRVALAATQLGYEDGGATIANVTTDTTLDVRLRPNPGPYIERTLAGQFDTYEEQGLASSTIRLSTRAGGVFDAVATSQRCDYDGWVSLVAESAGALFVDSHSGYCSARVRFVVPAADVQLTIRGFRATGWELTYREPR